MKHSIFISYRRDQELDVGHAKAIFQALKDHTQCHVFIDSSLVPGTKWSDEIRTALSDADTVLVIMGPNWIKSADEYGRRRIDQETDWVNQEISLALSGDKKLIPVLVNGAKLPSKEALPESLRGLLLNQAIEIRPNCYYDDIKTLAVSIPGKIFKNGLQDGISIVLESRNLKAGSSG